MILVTGASGNLGSKLIERLEFASINYRKAVRKADPDCIDQVTFDLLNPETFKSAVLDCDVVFLLRPPAISNMKQTLNIFIDVARKNGIKHIIFISVAGANRMVPHYAVEQHLKAGPLDWTILRPDFFMQNLEMAYQSDIRYQNEIYVPAGNGQISFIDVVDLAEVASKVIQDPTNYFGKTYTLTGPEALSFKKVASILSVELGRPIQYRPACVVGYILHLRKQRLGLLQIIVQTTLHFSLRFRRAQVADNLLADLLGHQGNTMKDYVRRERMKWL